MIRALIDGDLVVGRSVGLDTGPPIPEDLIGLPDDALRFDGRAIFDARARRQWHVDELGLKRLARADGRHQVACDWDARLVRKQDGWRAATATDDLARPIKLECRRRIERAMKDTATQVNMQSYASELLARMMIDKRKLSADDVAALAIVRAGREWVGEMQATARKLIAQAVDDFSDDRHWPDAPDGLADLVSRF